MLNASEIVDGLKGTNAAARFFGVQPPSVSEWVKKGVIPDDRLLRKAALLEECCPGFSRRTQWPDAFRQIWPELAAKDPADQGNTTADVALDRRVSTEPNPFPDLDRRAAVQGA